MTPRQLVQSIFQHTFFMNARQQWRNASPFVLALIAAQAWLIDAGLATLLSLLIPVAWAIQAKTRLHGGAIWLVYYLTVSSDMVPEINLIYPETPLLAAGAIWLACAAILSLPWVILWNKEPDQKQAPWRVIAALTLSTIPPIGIIGWTNPLLSSGVLFPGMNLSGLALTMLVPVALLLTRWPAVTLLAILATTSAVANFSYTERQADEAWFGQNTTMGQSPDADRIADWAKQRKALVTLANKAFDEGARVVVFPEMAAGTWDRFVTVQWIDTAMRAVEPGKGLVIGALAPAEKGGFLNGVIIVDEEGLRFKNGRIPIPLGVWQPWERNTAQPDWLGDGREKLAGREVALSICYEDFMVFAQAMSLHSINREPAHAVISIANNWFGSGRKGSIIQDASVRMMGRLFNVPVIRAVNR